MDPEPGSRTGDLLTRLGEGEAGAAAELMPLVYDQLRAQAAGYLAGRGPQGTLQPTVLVHEAYLRLAGQRRVPWQDKAHFAAIAAKAMREILVDHARGKGAKKRGGDRRRVTLQGISAGAVGDPLECLDLHAALEGLAALDAEQAAMVEMRFFGGLTLREIEAVTGVPRSTVERRLAMAQAWLLRAMDRDRDE